MVRKDGRITFLFAGESCWEPFCEFQRPSNEKLRARFKLQTSDETGEAGGGACPARVTFDNFKVNACDRIQAE